MIDVIVPHPELSPYVRVYAHSAIDLSKAGSDCFYDFTPTRKVIHVSEVRI